LAHPPVVSIKHVLDGLVSFWTIHGCLPCYSPVPSVHRRSPRGGGGSERLCRHPDNTWSKSPLITSTKRRSDRVCIETCVPAVEMLRVHPCREGGPPGPPSRHALWLTNREADRGCRQPALPAAFFSAWPRWRPWRERSARRRR
jgi:hypothetical protein